MLDHVEKDAGISIFFYEERTMDELIEDGKKIGVNVLVSDDFLKDDRMISKKEKSCISIVSNEVLAGTRIEKYDDIKKIV